MDRYDIDKILAYAQEHKIDISPSDRLEWALFGCALKVLGYNVDTFINLSHCSPEDCRKKWSEEKAPSRYFNGDESRAKAKLIALAKASGIDVGQFTAVTAVTADGKFAVNAVKAHSTPEKDFAHITPDTPDKPEPNYIPSEVISDKESKAKESALYIFLCSLFPIEEVEKVFGLYRVGGTSAFGEPYGSAFPYISTDGDCVDIHLMAYGSDGHRAKDKAYSQDWQLRKMGKGVGRGAWCLFGEHLLPLYPSAPIGVVESEKTALICALYFPSYIWVATGSKEFLTPERCRGAKGRSLYLFPDSDGVESWGQKAERLRADGFSVYLCSDTIKQYSRGAKDDLADISLYEVEERQKSPYIPLQLSVGEVSRRAAKGVSEL